MNKDILISFDDTGSMSTCIKQVRREVEKLVNDLFQFEDTRVAIVAHGDYCDGAKGFQYIDFTSDKSKVISFVKNAEDTFGGNADEFYELVLNKARGFDWQADTKILIMIGDAEPHPVGYRYSGFVNKLDWKEEARSLVNAGIKIYPVQCLNHRSSEYFYKGLADISGTPKLDLHQFADINRLLTAVFYKQVGNEKVLEYGNELKDSGLLNRNMANILDLLLESKNFIGGITFDEPVSSRSSFRSVSSTKAEWEKVDPTRFQILPVDRDTPIKEFVEESGATFKIGKGFYQLSKRELVQENKEVVLRDRKGDIFSGSKAREMIGLPYGKRGKISPLDIGYDVFIQSTSPNRKLIGGYNFLYEVDKR